MQWWKKKITSSKLFFAGEKKLESIKGNGSSVW